MSVICKFLQKNTNKKSIDKIFSENLSQLNSPMLSTNGLNIGYAPDVPLFKDKLNLEIASGKFISLLGANGTGKSTLLHTLAGLQKPLQGEIYLEGKNLFQLSAIERAKKIALVLSPRPVAPTLRVHEVVGLGLYPHQHNKLPWYQAPPQQQQQIITALEQTQLTHLAERKLHTLSDGEHQRVMIARALVQDTPLILLDEPTAHLDLPNRVMIFQLLKQLCKQAHKAILTTTHELSLAIQSSDTIWLTDTQKSFFCAAPEDLVLQDRFGQAFPELGFRFDKSTGDFQLQYPYKQEVILQGEGIYAHWTKKALERNHIKAITAQDTSKSLLKISLKQDEVVSWQIEYQAYSKQVFSIEALLNELALIEGFK